MTHSFAEASAGRIARMSLRRAGSGDLLIGITLVTGWTHHLAAQTQPGTELQEKRRVRGMSDLRTPRRSRSNTPPPWSGKPVSARVYVLLGQGQLATEPRFGPDWFRPQPFFCSRRSRSGSRRQRCADRLDGHRLPGSALDYARPVNTPSRRWSGSIRTPTASARAKGTPMGRSFTSRSGRSKRGQIRLTVDKLVPPRKFPGDRAGSSSSSWTARSCRPSIIARSSTARR